MRNGCQKRGIGFDQQPVFGYRRRDGLQIPGIFERHDPRDRDKQPKVERRLGKVVAGGEAMNHAGIRRPFHLFPEQRQRVGFGIASVDDNRQAGLLRRVDMAAKTILLPRPIALVVIIVEPGLADPDYARMRGALDQLGGIDIGMMIGIVRMDADASPDIGIGFRSGQDVVVHLSLKPTSSITVPGRTIDVTGQPVDVVTTGRHDPCVGLRATPIAEAMLAIVLLDHWLRHRGQNADVRSSTPVITAPR